MGIATALVGFIPPHSSLGIISLITLLFLRIIQSFCCGAEYINTSAYLLENSDTSNKGFMGSWGAFGTMTGMLVASLMALAVTYFINKYPDLEWIIWRIPFIVALLGSSIGLYIRLCVPESLQYILYYADHPKPKLTQIFTESFQYISQNKIKVLYVFLLSLLGVTSTFQIYVYAPNQAYISGNLSDYQIVMSNIISLIVLLIVFPFIGKLTDKINKEKIVIAASIGFLVLSRPFFNTLFYGTYPMLIMMQSLISIAAAAYYATVPVMIAEMFPVNLRCTVLSIVYSTAASLAGGLTPLVSLILLNKTGNSISPPLLVEALVIILFLVIGIRSKNANFNLIEPEYSQELKTDEVS